MTHIGHAGAAFLSLLVFAGSSWAVPLSSKPTGATQAASIASGNRLSIVRKLGSGNNQHAFLVKPRIGIGGSRVLKIFQRKTGPTSDPRVREELANIGENTARVLRSDPKFTARFGNIIPHTQVAGVGAMLQDFMAAGVPLSQLPESLRPLARTEATTAIKMAKARLGGLPTSSNLENFLFDPKNGRIVGWFDHLSHSNIERHLNVARANGFEKAPRDFMPGTNRPDGSLVRNPATGEVFLIRAGRRWHVPNPQVFAEMGLKGEAIENLDANRLEGIPLTRYLPVVRGPQLPGAGQHLSPNRAKKWHAVVEKMLETAVVVQSQSNSKHSANLTRIVTLRAVNGRLFRGVWKPVDGEKATIEPYPAGSPFAGLSPYPLRTLFKNEVRASKLAAALGLHFLVPPSVERTIDGQRGSLQLFVEGASTAKSRPAGATLERSAAEKLRVFDFLIGNADRSSANLMVRGIGSQKLPIGIDHGLTFPNGPVMGLRERPFPTEWIEGQVGPLLEGTRDFIRSIKPGTVARVLMTSGADPRQAAHMLRRIERLKRNPSFLEITRPGVEGMTEMLRRVADAADSRMQGLPPETIEKINQVIANAQH